MFQINATRRLELLWAGSRALTKCKRKNAERIQLEISLTVISSMSKTRLIISQKLQSITRWGRRIDQLWGRLLRAMPIKRKRNTQLCELSWKRHCSRSLTACWALNLTCKEAKLCLKDNIRKIKHPQIMESRARTLKPKFSTRTAYKALTIKHSRRCTSQMGKESGHPGSRRWTEDHQTNQNNSMQCFRTRIWHHRTDSLPYFSNDPAHTDKIKLNRQHLHPSKVCDQLMVSSSSQTFTISWRTLVMRSRCQRELCCMPETQSRLYHMKLIKALISDGSVRQILELFHLLDLSTLNFLQRENIKRWSRQRDQFQWSASHTKRLSLIITKPTPRLVRLSSTLLLMTHIKDVSKKHCRIWKVLTSYMRQRNSDVSLRILSPFSRTNLSRQEKQTLHTAHRDNLLTHSCSKRRQDHNVNTKTTLFSSSSTGRIERYLPNWWRTSLAN